MTTLSWRPAAAHLRHLSASTPASVSEPPSSTAVSSSETQSEAASDTADYTAYSINFDVPEGFEQVDATGTGASVIYQAEDGPTSM